MYADADCSIKAYEAPPYDFISSTSTVPGIVPEQLEWDTYMTISTGLD